MLLTIVIPAYNAATTLERALDRALRQAADTEFIVVDDCSDDDTLALARTLASRHPNLRVLRTEGNSGPGTARNLGIAAAQGQWIGFLDADDEFADGALPLLTKYLRRPNQGACDMLAFNWRYASEPLRKPPQPGEGREDFDALGHEDLDARLRAYLANHIDPSVIYHLYRRDFLQAAAIRFHSGYHEDVDFSFHACLSARRIDTLDRVIYLKWNQAGSIVNTLGLRHIDGYFDAIERIHALLAGHGLLPGLRPAFVDFAINVLSSRLARIHRDNVAKAAEPLDLLLRLHRRALALFDLIGVAPSSARPLGQLETRYYKMFAAFLQHMPAVNANGDASALMASLSDLASKSWSCFDLHHALFLAPDEIRTCCKRYFHRGQMKGDVVLLHGQEGQDFRFSYQDILREKSRLHRDINRNGASQCEGCPFLSFADWGAPLQQGIKYLSLEYHSVCNMRCTYCSPTYFGGRKAAYDVAHTVTSLGDNQALANCEYLVWGGGEPTLDKLFTPLTRQLAAYAPQVKQRIITNATKYLPELARLLADDQAFIVTSLDAGTEETFQEIRKFSGMERVLEHLRRYVQASPANTIVKYIALDNNMANAELDAFVRQVQNWSLLPANFQLSCDFRSEQLSLDETYAIAALYSRLQDLGAGFVFLDDLIWQRLPPMTPERREVLRARLGPALAEAERYPRIAIWGTGAQARIMMAKSGFLKDTEVACFIDPRPHLAGTEFLGRPIYPPEWLTSQSLPVVIAAVQSAPFIHQSLLAMKIAPERLVRRLAL
ncbi:radical SAM protein [Chromobacterium sp. Panama]|uniref:glycosyltransferase n=1 Tax=Chromobacterium sp. Panama TaxID=2161826 RepID=UPI000D2F8465|nr:glycosyltransferase [Chromobacterium sp. Panama]PTU67283.1 radical SAM protein [Chromobacterium sp. Panama]